MIDKTYDNFHKIVIEETPLIDVRAPIEFQKGAFINATNLPLMNDEDRHLIGICYKNKGNEAAVKLGHELVCGDIREKRTNDWLDALKKQPNSLLYCFRGGQRSQITQQWIKDASGLEIERLKGGYKAFRNYLIDALAPENQTSTPIILGGYTGSGKTILLKDVEYAVDLEGIANHRGSSFGNFTSPQPTQINFENNLAYKLIQHRHEGYKYMLLEDEGRNVGKCFLPKPLVEYYNKADMIILETPITERVKITMAEYVIESQQQYMDRFGTDKGLKEWADYIENSINKIKKRLGSEKHKLILDSFKNALSFQEETNTYDGHCEWVQMLLEQYYDPMYEYQIQKSTRKILLKGNYKEILDYLNSLK